MMPYRIKCFILLLLVLSTTEAIRSQELEPRAYLNIPTGLNFVLAGYAYSSGGVVFDPAVPLENANIQIHGTVMAYARSIRIGKMSGKVDLITPYAWLSGTADFQGQPVSREVSGLGDPRLRMSVNFLGAPALPLSGFKDYKQNLVLGASMQIFLPLGQYDPERLVNIGTNRFTFKPEVGISKKLKALILELTAGTSIFTANNDFYQHKTRSQAPIWSVQGHLNYTFRKGIWMSLNGTYYWGGHTTMDGIVGNDLQKNTRLGYTLSLPMSLHHSLRFHMSTGVSTRTGSDFDAIGLVWQYRWSKDLPKKRLN